MATVLALDVGSTQLRCIAVEDDGSISHSSFEAIETLHPRPGESEIDPERLWQSCKSVISQTISNVEIDRVRCLGITTQRSNVLLWNRTNGEPVCNVLTWQDRRCMGIVQEWNQSMSVRALRIGANLVYSISGLDRFKVIGQIKLKYQAAGPKVTWCLQNIPEAKALAAEGNLCFGGLDSWIVWKLTGGKVHAMDYSQASSTFLFDPGQMNWSGPLCKLMGVPSGILPALKNTVDDYGRCEHDLFGKDIPITASIADQQSSMFAHRCWDEGSAKCTLGTGSFILYNTGSKLLASNGGLYPLIGWKIGDKVTYVLEGGASSIGSAIEWACRFGIIGCPAESETMARKVEGSGGVFIVPAFDGLQAPNWDPSAATTIIGISHDTTPNHVARALLESFVFSVKQLYDLFQCDVPSQFSVLHLDGGVTKNKLLIEMLSSLLSLPLECPKVVEMTGLGAAYLAGLGAGVWSEKDIKNFDHESVVHKPEEPPAAPQVQPLNRAYRVWLKAVERSLAWEA